MVLMASLRLVVRFMQLPLSSKATYSHPPNKESSFFMTLPFFVVRIVVVLVRYFVVLCMDFSYVFKSFRFSFFGLFLSADIHGISVYVCLDTYVVT